MSQVTNGLAKIEISPVGAGGTVGTSWEVLGYTNIDSATITEEEGTTVDFPVEEIDTPILSRIIPGKTNINFQVADPSLDAFLDMCGGSLTGSGPTLQWNAPRIKPHKEFSIRITPQVGYILTFPRVVANARLNAPIGKNSILTLDVSASVLVPLDPSTPPTIIGGVVSQSSPSPQTITFAPLGTKSILGDSPITLSATASSGLPVSYMVTDPTKASLSGNILTLLATGTVDIIAIQNGNAAWEPAPPIVNTLTINA